VFFITSTCNLYAIVHTGPATSEAMAGVTTLASSIDDCAGNVAPGVGTAIDACESMVELVCVLASFHFILLKDV